MASFALLISSLSIQLTCSREVIFRLSSGKKTYIRFIRYEASLCRADYARGGGGGRMKSTSLSFSEEDVQTHDGAERRVPQSQQKGPSGFLHV